MSGNFVGNRLTPSEAIETYTPYDVTSSRPRKTKIAFFANFGGAPVSQVLNGLNPGFLNLEQRVQPVINDHLCQLT